MEELRAYLLLVNGEFESQWCGGGRRSLATARKLLERVSCLVPLVEEGRLCLTPLP